MGGSLPGWRGGRGRIGRRGPATHEALVVGVGHGEGGEHLEGRGDHAPLVGARGARHPRRGGVGGWGGGHLPGGLVTPLLRSATDR